MKFLRNLSVALIVIGGLLAIQMKRRAEENGPLSDSVTVVLERGTSSQKAAELLFENGVISSPLLFRLVLKYQNQENKLKAGEYLFEPRVSMLKVIDKLVSGDIVYHKVTIPEGYTVGQTMYLLSMNDNLSGEFDTIPPEGMFLPETYTFPKGEDRNLIMRKAMAEMRKKLQEIWDTRDEGLPYKNREDLLIMASIIEKETAVDDERFKVASVFVNRLRRGMRLQTDPTVIYALTEGKEELKRPLTRKDLEIDSVYNTYKNTGLPPTPICNPGEASLYAAAHPDKTDYLYFVANGSGGHNFAKTLKEHNRNVADWKKRR